MSDALPPTRVHVVKAAHGLRAGQKAWVAGNGVQELLDDGTLIEVGNVQQRGRMWRVGQHTYADRRDALRVAKATGSKAIEVA